MRIVDIRTEESFRRTAIPVDFNLPMMVMAHYYGDRFSVFYSANPAVHSSDCVRIFIGHNDWDSDED